VRIGDDGSIYYLSRISAGETYFYALGDDDLLDFRQEYYHGLPAFCEPETRLSLVCRFRLP